MPLVHLYWDAEFYGTDLSEPTEVFRSAGHTVVTQQLPAYIKAIGAPQADITVFIMAAERPESEAQSLQEIVGYLGEWFREKIFIAAILGKGRSPRSLDNFGALGPNARVLCSDAVTDLDWWAIVRYIATFEQAKQDDLKAAREDRKEQQERVELKATQFVQEALTSLEERERRYRTSSSVWYSIGYATLAAGIISNWLGGASVLTSSNTNLTSHDVSWVPSAVILLRNITALALVIAATKYSFDLGKASASESVRNADRRHAINFGRFYLSAYGDTATWPEIKEAFAQWNIDNPSVFSQLKSSDYDPKLIETLASVAKAFTKEGSSSKKLEPHV